MKIGFFEESEGVKSAMRLNSHLALWFSFIITGFAVWTKQVDANLIAIVTLFVVAAFVPKAVQKFAEMKGGKVT